jgi:RimJ/RimL family protein N-acetyltransferase
MIPLPLPRLFTPRLLLRRLVDEDAAAIFDYAKRPDVGPSAGWEPHTSIDDTLRFIHYTTTKREHGQPGVYAIVHRAENKVIGTIEIHSYRGYKGEIGFVLHPAYWNQGLVTEAAKAVIIYAMDVLELKRLTYCHFPDNHASRRVCEKLGFTYEGVLRDKFLRYDGVLLDDVTYSIVARDYYAGKIRWVEPFKAVMGIDETP